MTTPLRVELRDRYGEELIFLDDDDFDAAVIGVMSDGPVVYDAQKIVDILVDRDGMDRLDAHEYFSFNIEDAHFGDFTPYYVWPLHYEKE